MRQHTGEGPAPLVWDDMWARRGNVRVESFSASVARGEILVIAGAPIGLLFDVTTGGVAPYRGRILYRGVDISGDLTRKPDVAGIVGGAPRLYGRTGEESVLTHLALTGLSRQIAVSATRRILGGFGLHRLGSLPLHRLDDETLWVLDLARALSPQPDLLLVHDPWRHFGADRALREKFLLGLTYAAAHPQRPAAVVLCTKDPSATNRLREMPGGSRTSSLMLSYHGRTVAPYGALDADAG